jgi:hypothetical protein
MRSPIAVVLRDACCTPWRYGNAQWLARRDSWMTLVISSTFLFARPKVPSYDGVSREFDAAVTVGEWVWVACIGGRRTLFFARRRARLSLAFRSNSMTRFSYGARLYTSKSATSHCLQYSSGGRRLEWHDPLSVCMSSASPRRRVRSVTYPATSRVISLTNAVLLERKPFLREILAAGVLGVTSVRAVSSRSLVAVE